MSGHYDVALVCPNGHVANASTKKYPEHNAKFCSRCGEANISACPGCNQGIQGEFYFQGVAGWGTYHPPAFCVHCGRGFPWTERKQQAAIALFEDEVASVEEREVFRSSIVEIAKDTPQAQVAGNRIARALKKLGTGTASAIRDIAVDVASEAVKKSLLPGP